MSVFIEEQSRIDGILRGYEMLKHDILIATISSYRSAKKKLAYFQRIYDEDNFEGRYTKYGTYQPDWFVKEKIQDKIFACERAIAEIENDILSPYFRDLESSTNCDKLLEELRKEKVVSTTKRSPYMRKSKNL